MQWLKKIEKNFHYVFKFIGSFGIKFEHPRTHSFALTHSHSMASVTISKQSSVICGFCASQGKPSAHSLAKCYVLKNTQCLNCHGFGHTAGRCSSVSNQHPKHQTFLPKPKSTTNSALELWCSYCKAHGDHKLYAKKDVLSCPKAIAKKTQSSAPKAKAPYCGFCEEYGHWVKKSPDSLEITCPKLLEMQCPNCNAFGHLASHCELYSKPEPEPEPLPKAEPEPLPKTEPKAEHEFTDEDRKLLADPSTYANRAKGVKSKPKRVKPVKTDAKRSWADDSDSDSDSDSEDEDA